MLKWTSESEYFLSFENFFADTIYIIQSKSNHERSEPTECSYQSRFVGYALEN